MASYPTTPHTFTGFSNGALSDAAQVTDIYAEVEAIEAGIINGTARVQSSNLSVLGTSTFASRPVLPPPDVVKLGLSDTVALAGASTTAVPWTRQDIITNSSMHSTTTNPTRVTPQTTGVYLCVANIYFQSAAGGQQFVNIEDSSGTFIAHGQSMPTTGLRTVSVSGVKRFDSLTGSTQWVRAVVQGGTSTNSLSTIAGYTQFEVYKL